jgi:hypothetical protein
MWEEGTGTTTSSPNKVFTLLIYSFVKKKHLKFSAILKTIFHIIEFAFYGIPKWKHIKKKHTKKESPKTLKTKSTKVGKHRLVKKHCCITMISNVNWVFWFVFEFWERKKNLQDKLNFPWTQTNKHEE